MELREITGDDDRPEVTRNPPSSSARRSSSPPLPSAVSVAANSPTLNDQPNDHSSSASGNTAAAVLSSGETVGAGARAAGTVPSSLSGTGSSGGNGEGVVGGGQGGNPELTERGVSPSSSVAAAATAVAGSTQGVVESRAKDGKGVARGGEVGTVAAKKMEEFDFSALQRWVRC